MFSNKTFVKTKQKSRFFKFLKRRRLGVPEDSVETMEMFEVRPSWIETTQVLGEDIPPGSCRFQIVKIILYKINNYFAIRSLHILINNKTTLQ